MPPVESIHALYFSPDGCIEHLTRAIEGVIQVRHGWSDGVPDSLVWYVQSTGSGVGYSCGQSSQMWRSADGLGVLEVARLLDWRGRIGSIA